MCVPGCLSKQANGREVMIGRTGPIRAGGYNFDLGAWHCGRLTTTTVVTLCGWPRRSRHIRHQASAIPRAIRSPAISLPFALASHHALSRFRMPARCFKQSLRNHFLRHNNTGRKPPPATPPPLLRHSRQPTTPRLLFQSQPPQQTSRHTPGIFLYNSIPSVASCTSLHQSLTQPQPLYHRFDLATKGRRTL
jgi:hypothetical protein